MNNLSKHGRLSVIVIFVAVIVIYLWVEVNVPAVKRESLDIPGITEGTKIVQISDAHGRGISENGRLFRAIRDFSPDFIVLTGDVIDESTSDFEPALETVRDLSGIAPVFFVPGNHERANPKGESFISAIRRAGAAALINEAVTIGDISLCGVDDINFGLDDVSAAIADSGRCDILLSHSPAIYEVIRGEGIPLVLSGHTHGGQVRLPLIGELILPDKNIPKGLVKGTWSDEGTTFYVSVGLGTSVVPLRFMNRAAIDLLTIN
jgi:hypothetical protein